MSATKLQDDVDPYQAFDLWMRRNGFQDVATCEPEDVDLDRLTAAVETYGQAN